MRYVFRTVYKRRGIAGCLFRRSVIIVMQSVKIKVEICRYVICESSVSLFCLNENRLRIRIPIKSRNFRNIGIVVRNVARVLAFVFKIPFGKRKSVKALCKTGSSGGYYLTARFEIIFKFFCKIFIYRYIVGHNNQGVF